MVVIGNLPNREREFLKNVNEWFERPSGTQVPNNYIFTCLLLPKEVSPLRFPTLEKRKGGIPLQVGRVLPDSQSKSHGYSEMKPGFKLRKVYLSLCLSVKCSALIMSVSPLMRKHLTHMNPSLLHCMWILYHLSHLFTSPQWTDNG